MILWPLLLYASFAAIIVGAMLLLSSLLGERHVDRGKGDPYESGIPPTGSARIPYGAQFYLVAVFFVVFDLEAAFLFAWAVAAKDVGWAGYVEAAVFVGVLLAALVYLWRDGALDWGTPFKLVGRQPDEAELGEGSDPWIGG